jgi:hypothetical protein
MEVGTFMDWSGVLQVALWVFGVAFLAGYAAFIVTAVIQVLRRKQILGTSRVIWIVGIFAFPLIGSLAWYFFGDRTNDVERFVAR